jgi:hypothetical protein
VTKFNPTQSFDNQPLAYSNTVNLKEEKPKDLGEFFVKTERPLGSINGGKIDFEATS